MHRGYPKARGLSTAHTERCVARRSDTRAVDTGRVNVGRVNVGNRAPEVESASELSKASGRHRATSAVAVSSDHTFSRHS